MSGGTTPQTLLDLAVAWIFKLFSPFNGQLMNDKSVRDAAVKSLMKPALRRTPSSAKVVEIGINSALAWIIVGRRLSCGSVLALPAPGSLFCCHIHKNSAGELGDGAAVTTESCSSLLECQPCDLLQTSWQIKDRDWEVGDRAGCSLKQSHKYLFMHSCSRG